MMFHIYKCVCDELCKIDFSHQERDSNPWSSCPPNSVTAWRRSLSIAWHCTLFANSAWLLFLRTSSCNLIGQCVSRGTKYCSRSLTGYYLHKRHKLPLINYSFVPHLNLLWRRVIKFFFNYPKSNNKKNPPFSLLFANCCLICFPLDNLKWLQVLHTVLCLSPMVLTRRICLTIKTISFHSVLRSFPWSLVVLRGEFRCR